MHPSLSREHCALVMGEVRGRRHVPVRVHSECLTGEGRTVSPSNVIAVSSSTTRKRRSPSTATA